MSGWFIPISLFQGLPTGLQVIGPRSNLQRPARSGIFTLMKTTTIKPQIYLVDDDEAVRKALSRLLKAAGYVGEAFASAEDFLAAVPPGSDGILLLDLRMPGIDGFELQKRLQILCPQLPVIFITGHFQAGDRKRALAAGAKGFLIKPFDGETLLSLLESVISEKK